VVAKRRGEGYKRSGLKGAAVTTNGDGNKVDTSYVQWLKGLAIILVVVGHFYSADFSSIWIEGARRVIYLFHMPLFMAISGFLYARSPPLSLGMLVKKKFFRLMAPYVSISALVLFAKWVAGWVHFPLHYPLDRGDLWAFLFTPQQGFACFLWFIYTLFLIFCVVRVAQASRIPLWLLLVASFGLRFLPLPREFCLDLVGVNLVYFVFGMGLERVLGKGPFQGRGREWAVAVFAFSGFVALVWGMWFKGIQEGVWPLLAAFSGILFCWFLALRTARWWWAPLAWLGGTSSTIYLLHTLCMGVTRYVWEQQIGVDSGQAQILFFMSSVLLALVVPSLLQRLVLVRFPRVCKIFLGMQPKEYRPQVIRPG
jgi:fucose 4-O-acetylase-like acetyltransferase